MVSGVNEKVYRKEIFFFFLKKITIEKSIPTRDSWGNYGVRATCILE